jgi:hypothetical protein
LKASSSESYKQVLNSDAVLATLEEKWWRKYIFHFSDINNIANILNSGYMYSRNHSKLQMKNDNASREVINGTTDMYKDYVRFYFRPLTPTQFNNEGIKSKSQITGFGAHCPVPVFLSFNANSLLSRDDSYFSYESLASHYNVPLYNSVKDFKNAPFEYIYHNRYFVDGEDRRQIIKHRHAEVIIKDQYKLADLEKIIVRNMSDALTLKTLMTRSAFEKYKQKFRISNKYYFNRYMSLHPVSLDEGILNFKWANAPSNTSFDIKIDFMTIDENETICHYYESNYSPEPTEIDTQHYLKELPKILIQIRLNDNLIYKNIHFTSKKSHLI